MYERKFRGIPDGIFEMFPVETVIKIAAFILGGIQNVILGGNLSFITQCSSEEIIGLTSGWRKRRTITFITVIPDGIRRKFHDNLHTVIQ